MIKISRMRQNKDKKDSFFQCRISFMSLYYFSFKRIELYEKKPNENRLKMQALDT